MSAPVRQAGPGAPDAARAGPTGHAARTLAWVLAGAVVAAQITYPLLSGAALTVSTILTVLLFAAASLVSAAVTHGVRAAAAVLLVAGSVGLVAEAVGVATGFPFGDYAYAGTLGPQLAGVPVIIPLAWTMMAWPTLLAGRAVADAAARRWPGGGGARWLAVLPAAWALASWDLYLDAQMVAAGHWAWERPSPALPGVAGIPVTNFAGWLLVALVIQALLHLVVGGAVGGAGGDRARAGGVRAGRGAWGPPALLLGWTWLGSGLANLVFFSRPGVGLWGLGVMGLVVGPYLVLGARARAAPRR